MIYCIESTFVDYQKALIIGITPEGQEIFLDVCKIMPKEEFKYNGMADDYSVDPWPFIGMCYLAGITT